MSEAEDRKQVRNENENQYLFSYHVPRIARSRDIGSRTCFAV